MKFNIYGSILVIISLTLWIGFYNRLPDSIPIHWGINGSIDANANKLVVLLIFNSVLIFIYFLDYLSPKLKLNNGGVRVIMNCIMTFFLAISLLVLYNGLGYQIGPSIILALLGVLFIMLGLLIPKININSVTSFTKRLLLENEEAIRKNVDFTGTLFIICGGITVCSAFLPSTIAFVIFIINITTLLLILIIYTYILRKNLKRSNVYK